MVCAQIKIGGANLEGHWLPHGFHFCAYTFCVPGQVGRSLIREELSVPGFFLALNQCEKLRVRCGTQRNVKNVRQISVPQKPYGVRDMNRVGNATYVLNAVCEENDRCNTTFIGAGVVLPEPISQRRTYLRAIALRDKLREGRSCLRPVRITLDKLRCSEWNQP